jgi:EAL domain-containing protein (putative c-di-GMP-specific phosphodiesterase class I)
LKRFAIDAVKIDRTFVDGLGRDPTALQGFIFARPMPGAAIDKLIAASHHWPDG